MLKTIVSGTLYSQLTSIKTDIIIDTWAMIFPSRSQLASKQIRRTGRAEAVTKEGLAATLLQDVSPIKWDNVILYGQYVLDRARVR